ncbi:hypothetical protein [Marinifilum sp.]|uniref:hypothetical protein n=1 Tax=Marinifilum sp. TaxID=2033137 RepID=UPI003BAD779C
MITTKKENLIIDLLEDTVTVSRIFDNIEKVTGCDLIATNGCYPIICLMGLDLDKCTNHDLLDTYNTIFSNYTSKDNDNRDTAILIYNKFKGNIADDLKHSPHLSISYDN